MLHALNVRQRRGDNRACRVASADTAKDGLVVLGVLVDVVVAAGASEAVETIVWSWFSPSLARIQNGRRKRVPNPGLQ